MERRFLQNERARVSVEKRADGKEVIAGYAAVFYDPNDPGTEYVLWDDKYGRAVERVMPGAFDLTNDVRGLFNHNPSLLLGRSRAGTMRLSIDTKGLRYEIDPAETTSCKDLVEHIRRGDLSGSSFSFGIPPEGQKWTTVQTGDKWSEVRELLKVELFDVGPVTFPAYESTTSELRHASDSAVLREERRKLAAIQSDPKADHQAIAARTRAVELQSIL